MSDQEKSDHWDLLSSELGTDPPAQKPKEAAKPKKAEWPPEAEQPKQEPQPVAEQPKPKPIPEPPKPAKSEVGASETTAWDALAGELGIEVQPKPDRTVQQTQASQAAKASPRPEKPAKKTAHTPPKPADEPFGGIDELLGLPKPPKQTTADQRQPSSAATEAGKPEVPAREVRSRAKASPETPAAKQPTSDTFAADLFDEPVQKP
ncbi:MAG TPA: hypothetical protein VE890_09525, partial [Thermoguttaceae bacterium]|nr:hypothetical protein [Thermoguttaceae bacterium]